MKLEILAYLDQAVDLFKEELGDNLSGFTCMARWPWAVFKRIQAILIC